MRVGTRGFCHAASLSNTVRNKVCIFTDVSLAKSLFLPAFSVCGFHFSKVTHQTLQSWASCASLCVLLGAEEGEAVRVHLSSPMLRLPPGHPPTT